MGRRAVIAAFAGLGIFAVVVSYSIGGSAAAKPGAYPTPGAVRVGRAHPAEAIPALGGSKPIFILVLGSDTRSKQLKAAYHSRCDSIHLIGINPKKGEATVLGFPRDSWVNIQGHGMDKINDTMEFGGPPLAISTIEGMTGIHIDYYVLTTFQGFKSAVSQVGGIKVDVPYAINDSHSKAHFKKGVKKMTGKQALSFVRARYDVPNGDFSRSENQGIFMMNALDQFQQQYSDDPSMLFRWLGAGVRNVVTDLPLDELLKLSFTATKVDNVTNYVVPGSTGTEGTQSVVHLDAGAKSLYADMSKDGLIELKAPAVAGGMPRPAKGK